MKNPRYIKEQIAFALKQLVADLSLNKHVLQGVLANSSDAWAAEDRRARSGAP